MFALWLPETLNKKLPASVAEVEASAKRRKNERTLPELTEAVKLDEQ